MIIHNNYIRIQVKKKDIYDDFIHKYSIDMSIFTRPDYSQYSTVNDWFTRDLNSNPSISLRQVAPMSAPTVVTSPADARLMVFPNIKRDIGVWIKGETFHLNKLLDNDTLANEFAGGSMVIVRLAPQDYHRFHSPVDGMIEDERFAEGTIFSVSADGMTSGNAAYLNQRVITTIDTGDQAFGRMAMVSIGATCVGSIYMLHRPGYVLHKGETMGYFQFGGSTCVLVFGPGKVNFDSDLISHSIYAAESLVRVGQQVASKPE